MHCCPARIATNAYLTSCVPNHVYLHSSGTPANECERPGISRRAAISQMAMLSLLASNARLPGASASEGAPQVLQGDVKAAVMQAFKKAADKGKVKLQCIASITFPFTRNVGMLPLQLLTERQGSLSLTGSWSDTSLIPFYSSHEVLQHLSSNSASI